MSLEESPVSRSVPPLNPSAEPKTTVPSGPSPAAACQTPHWRSFPALSPYPSDARAPDAARPAPPDLSPLQERGTPRRRSTPLQPAPCRRRPLRRGSAVPRTTHRPGRAAVSVVVIIVLAVAAVLLVRSARSLLGRPGESRRARFVLGLVLLAVGGIGIQATLAAPSRRSNLEDIDLGIGVALALFGAALAFEGWWHRGRTSSLPGRDQNRADLYRPSRRHRTHPTHRCDERRRLVLSHLVARRHEDHVLTCSFRERSWAAGPLGDERRRNRPDAGHEHTGEGRIR